MRGICHWLHSLFPGWAAQGTPPPQAALPNPPTPDPQKVMSCIYLFAAASKDASAAAVAAASLA